MKGLGTVLTIAPTILNLLRLRGINVDEEFSKALEIIPNFIAEKQKEYTDKHPDLDINLMAIFHENEVFIMPVGLESIEGKTIISKQFDPINISKFLAGIKVTKIIDVLKNNPDLPIMEAVEKSKEI